VDFLVTFEATIRIVWDDANGPALNTDLVQSVQDAIGHTGAVVEDVMGSEEL